MITLYDGTPGSGKSLHVAQVIRDSIYAGKPVIANFPINMDVVKQRRKNRTKSDSVFYYWDMSEISAERLIDYASKYHKPGKESQTLVVIDECGIIFNSREWQSDKGSRMKWINFFMMHRKLGFDIILIAQMDRMIDRQIRGFLEYEIVHRKANSLFKWGMGDILDKMKIKLFVAVKRYYGMESRIEASYFFYNPKQAALYDTMQIFSKEKTVKLQTLAPEPAAPASAEGCPTGGVPSPTPPCQAPQVAKQKHKSFKLEKKQKKDEKLVIGYVGCRGRSAVVVNR